MHESSPATFVKLCFGSLKLVLERESSQGNLSFRALEDRSLVFLGEPETILCYQVRDLGQVMKRSWESQLEIN